MASEIFSGQKADWQGYISDCHTPLLVWIPDPGTQCLESLSSFMSLSCMCQESSENIAKWNDLCLWLTWKGLAREW